MATLTTGKDTSVPEIQCHEYPYSRSIYSETKHVLCKMFLQDPGQRPPKEDLDDALV